MTFEKIPGKIEAVQFTGGNFKEISEFCNKTLAVSSIEESPSYNIRKIIYNNSYDKNTMTIQTYAGDLTLRKNDWIIQGNKGNFYICDPEVFYSNYKKTN